MSYAGKRQEIADALNATGLVKAYAYRPSSPKTGDAWVQLGVSTRVGIAYEDNWSLIIILPQTDASGKAADVWRDTNQVAIVDSLEEGNVGFVDEIIPVMLGDQFALQFNFRSN